jgi:uncharacterized protein with FMN-binding domain
MSSPRHLVAAGLSAVALALPVADALAATPPEVTKKVVSKSYTGDTVEAGRWGPLQVTAVVRTTTTKTTRTVNGKTKTTTKVTRKLTTVRVPLYPNHTDRSVFINQEALPLLVQETLQAQSANVDLISRATDTSEAFVSSLRSALEHVK